MCGCVWLCVYAVLSYAVLQCAVGVRVEVVQVQLASPSRGGFDGPHCAVQCEAVRQQVAIQSAVVHPALQVRPLLLAQRRVRQAEGGSALRHQRAQPLLLLIHPVHSPHLLVFGALADGEQVGRATGNDDGHKDGRPPPPRPHGGVSGPAMGRKSRRRTEGAQRAKSAGAGSEPTTD